LPQCVECHELDAERGSRIQAYVGQIGPTLPRPKARTVEELWGAIAGVSKEECKAYLANSGYT
jgi:hypothetical protein